MQSILKKELSTYFSSIGAYIIAFVFAFVCSLFLWFFENNFNIFNIGLASLNSFFNLAPWLLLFLIPALTMKSIAEEQQTETLYWLFSQPISITSIVLAKFIAVVIIAVFCLIPTFIFVYTILKLSLIQSDIDFGTIISGYIGLIFISLAFSAIGIFSSSLAKNQVMGFIIGVFLCFIAFFGLGSLGSYSLLGNFDYIIQKVGIYQHYTSFTKGIIDTKDIGYFIFIILAFILSSIQLVKRKKQ